MQSKIILAIACFCAAASAQNVRCNYPSSDDNAYWDVFSQPNDESFTFPFGTRAVMACMFPAEPADPDNVVSICGADGTWSPVSECIDEPDDFTTPGHAPEDRCQQLSVMGVSPEEVTTAFQECVNAECVGCANPDQGWATCQHVSIYDNLGPTQYIENICAYTLNIWGELPGVECQLLGCGVRDRPVPDWSPSERAGRALLKQSIYWGDSCDQDEFAMRAVTDFGPPDSCAQANMDTDGPMQYFEWHCEDNDSVLHIFEDPACSRFVEARRASELPMGCHPTDTVSTKVTVESPCGQPGACFDWPRDWFDIAGSSCGDYERNGWCNEAWVESLANSQGVHAKTACCVCGGGRGDVGNPTPPPTQPSSGTVVLPLHLNLPTFPLGVEGEVSKQVLQFDLPLAPGNISDLTVTVRAAPGTSELEVISAVLCCGSFGNMFDFPDEERVEQCELNPVAAGQQSEGGGMPGGGMMTGMPGGGMMTRMPGGGMMTRMPGGGMMTRMPGGGMMTRMPMPRPSGMPGGGGAGPATVISVKDVGRRCAAGSPYSVVVWVVGSYTVHARLQRPQVSLLPLPIFRVQSGTVAPGQSVTYEFNVPRRVRLLQIVTEVGGVDASVMQTSLWNHWDFGVGQFEDERRVDDGAVECYQLSEMAGSKFYITFHSAQKLAKYNIQALVNNNGPCDFVR